MKSNSVIISFLLALTLFSCKDDARKKNEASTNEPKKIAYTITLNAIVTVDDSFQLFYKEADQIPYEESTIVTVDIKGKPEAQDIVFNLEEGSVPYFIRIDIGSSEKQQPMVLKNLKFAHNGKSFDIPGDQFLNFFSHNECVKIQETTPAGLAVSSVKSEASNFDPLIYSGEALFQKIDALVKGK